MKKTSQKLLRSIDIYGHQVTLNLDLQEKTYKTPFGGMATLLFGILILSIFWSNSQKINDSDHASVTEDLMLIDSAGAEKYSYKEMNMFGFFLLRK